MTKENGAETPSQEIVRKANKTASFTDAQGREIVIKKLTPVDEYSLYKIIGKAQENQGQFMTLATLYHVVSIGGELVVKGSLLQIEAILQRIGDSFNELMIEVMKLEADKMDDVQKMQDEIKNLQPGQT